MSNHPQPDAVLKFSRFGKAPEHHFAAAVHPSLEPDFFAATGIYRITPGYTADRHLLGYQLTYTPMCGGGEIPARREELGWEGGLAVAKEQCARHLRRMRAEEGLADQTVAVV